jgi:hypothetical protein
MYGYVNAVVLDVRGEQPLQGGRPAANIEQGSRPASGDPVYDSGGFLETMMRSCIFQVLCAPKIFLVVSYHPVCVILRAGILVADQAIHNESS